jgi:hypothetical protein
MAYQVKEGRMLNLLRPGETDAFSAASALPRAKP